MTRRVVIAAALVALLVGALAVPALAGGGPDRYQITTTNYTVILNTQWGNVYHYFVLTFNPCDGTFTGTGSTPAGPQHTHETITGTLVGGMVSFESTYSGPYLPGYIWWGSFPVGGGTLAANDGSWGPYTGPVVVTSSSGTQYKNHGQYVTEAGGGADAAHSCIGMPIQARP